jgi:hypothetical protein
MKNGPHDGVLEEERHLTSGSKLKAPFICKLIGFGPIYLGTREEKLLKVYKLLSPLNPQTNVRPRSTVG